MLSRYFVSPAVITFDDISAPRLILLERYKNFEWSRFFVVNGQYFGRGFAPGTISSPNVLLSYTPASFKYLSGTFSVVSLYLTGGFCDLTVTVTGSIGGTTVASVNLSIFLDRPTLFKLSGFNGLDTLTFTPNEPEFFILDNIAVFKGPSA